MNPDHLVELNQEYQEFRSLQGIQPPRGVSEAIVASVRADLNPSAWKVFSKLSLIHFLTGALTLALCPQFGIRLVGDGLGIMKAFAHFGLYGCMAACGAFFVGSSLLVAGFALRPEEIRVLRHHEILQLGLISLLSLGAFVMLEAEILLGFAVTWALGSLLGGAAMLELSWQVRRRLHLGGLLQ